MTIDELFVLTLDDIENRLQPGHNEYEVLRIAGLLRQLFLDPIPLIHAVNEHRRLRVRFEVTDLQPRAGDISWMPADTLHPASRHPGEKTVICTLEQFLKRFVLVAGGEHVNVHELIDFLSHTYGAVHAGRATTAKEEALRDTAWGARLSGPEGVFSGPVYMLRPIARITLDGLDKLRRILERETTLGGLVPSSARGLRRHDDPEHRDLARPRQKKDLP